MKCIWSWFGILVVMLVVIWIGFQRTHAPLPIENEVPKWKISAETSQAVAQMIEVTTPTINATVSQPLTVTGRARGGWYFEASFPVELRDSSGALLAQTIAQAQWPWMTDTFVPFTATLNYAPQPAWSTGTLTLKRSNPSGEPQNDMSLVIPVQF